mgnify:FL=1
MFPKCFLCNRGMVQCSHGQQKTLDSSPGRATRFHLLQIGPNIKRPLWGGGLVCMSFVDEFEVPGEVCNRVGLW